MVPDVVNTDTHVPPFKHGLDVHGFAGEENTMHKTMFEMILYSKNIYKKLIFLLINRLKKSYKMK